MQELENPRLRRLEEMTRVDESPISQEAGVLIAPGEAKEEGEFTQDTNPEFPLTALMIIGIVVTVAAWMFLIYAGVGLQTVQQTLGNHFMK